jgi:hypothetical protein
MIEYVIRKFNYLILKILENVYHASNHKLGISGKKLGILRGNLFKY